MNRYAMALLAASLALPLYAERKTALPSWTAADREIWAAAVKAVMTKPPCCGACGRMTLEEARTIWRLIRTLPEKTADKDLEIWQTYEKRLLEEFKRIKQKRRKNP